MSRYLTRLSTELAAHGLRQDLLVMQGNAGTMSAGFAASHAAQTVMSGPAAGALAAARIGRDAGFPNVIGCDMGGTSFDVSLIRDGQPAISAEKDIAYGVPVRVPMIDIHTIGAGGGSIARVNRAGILQVGPDSAGSRPGPVCYGRGGTMPTVTDANLLLGRLDPAGIPGVETVVSLDKVRAAMQREVGDKLGLTAAEAAAAVIAVATNHLASAIRLVSIERGQDPRDLALFAFGGAGPLHATALALELGIPHVLVPAYPGATSALGCILADVRHDYVQAVNRPLLQADAAAVSAVLAQQAAQGAALILAEGVPVSSVVAVHEADCMFAGQSHVFRVPVGSVAFDPVKLMGDFARLYAARFDIELRDMRAMLVNVRTAVLGLREVAPSAPPSAGPTATPQPRTVRAVYFNGLMHETPVFPRAALPPGVALSGPAIIEQGDATTVLDPGAHLHVDASGNMIIAPGDQA